METFLSLASQEYLDHMISGKYLTLFITGRFTILPLANGLEFATSSINKVNSFLLRDSHQITLLMKTYRLSGHIQNWQFAVKFTTKKVALTKANGYHLLLSYLV